MDVTELAGAIDALLPQTQCTKCGFPGCRPYAEAIVHGEADINQCPPGGTATIRGLAALLGREFKPLNPAHGVEQARTMALIDEGSCIGCTLCIQACPVDAIAGAPKRMHTVLLEYCTGCELCLPPCPVDCIDMVEVSELQRRGASLADQSPRELAEQARARYMFHQLRSARESAHRAVLPSALAGKVPERTASKQPVHDRERKRAAIQAAFERARARRAAAKAQ
ncbi:MAG TPA: electron transport complex subunit RsxB [Burkholderiales bacterium]|nr:electron transport complex subunit RsxB [Burkholderiales bacterium]